MDASQGFSHFPVFLPFSSSVALLPLPLFPCPNSLYQVFLQILTIFSFKEPLPPLPSHRPLLLLSLCHFQADTGAGVSDLNLQL